MEMDLDSIIQELTSNTVSDHDALISSLEPTTWNPSIETLNDETVPENVRSLMQNAIGNQGVKFNLNTILYEDDNDADVHHPDRDALDEIETALGPDASDKLFEANVPYFRRKRRRRRRTAKAYQALSQALNDNMVRANMLYIQGRDEEAILALRQVIQERPDTDQAWLSLGMIYNKKKETEKAVQCKLMAAHLSPSNSDLWVQLGFSSMELGYRTQALYCFQKAIENNPKDVVSRWWEAMIYIQDGMEEDGSEKLQQLLAMNPLHRDAIVELGRIFIRNGRSMDAIPYFLALIEADLTEPLDDDEEFEDEKTTGFTSMGCNIARKSRMGYEELSMLSELYIDAGLYREGSNTLKKGIYTLLNVPASDTYLTNDNDIQDFDIPLPIIAKMAMFRIYQDDEMNASVHLDILKHGTIEALYDLYFDIGVCYLKKKQFSKARELFQSLIVAEEEEVNAEIWRKLSECDIGLFDYNSAIDMLDKLLNVEPTDKDAQNQLIELLENSGRSEEAQKKLVAFRSNTNTRLSQKYKQTLEGDREPSEYKPLLSAPYRKSKATEKRKTTNTKLAADSKVAAIFAKLNDYGRHEWNSSEYQEMVRELLSAFAPGETDNGHVRLFVKQEEVFLRQNMTENPKLDIKLHGITYKNWFNFLYKYSKFLLEIRKEESCYTVLQAILKKDNLFHDAATRYKTLILLIYAANSFKNFSKVAQVCRSFCSDEEYLSEALRFYCSALLDYKPQANDNVFVAKELKFFKRLGQKIDEMPYSEELQVHLNAVLGHLQLCNKGYALAIKFYLKSIRLRPNDKILNLCVGIAFVHRSLQKNDLRSENITRGLAFLRKYSDLIGSCPESWYNLGRAYQHFGLPHLAIPYYEKVLADPDDDLHFSAGHNLAMLYVNSGSLHLAQDILKKHCTI